MENTITKDGAWEVLETEYLVRRPWLTARRDKVKLPDGRVNDEYYVLEYPDWVNVIAMTEDGQMVMERQYRHAAGVTCYELPCGVMEKGETPLEAAKRELEEETGYTGGTWQEWMTLSPNTSAMTNRSHTFIATGVRHTSEQNLDANEDLSVHLLSQEYVRQLLINNQILQSLQAAPLWKFFYENKQL